MPLYEWVRRVCAPARFRGTRLGIDRVAHEIDMVEQGVKDLDTQPQREAPRAARPAGTFGHRDGQDAANRINVQFQAGPSAAAWARNALTAVEHRLDSDLMADVRLLVSELVTNSVRHSHMTAGEPVGLDVSVDSRGVRVEVLDSGGGFDPRPRDRGRSEPGGWGLLLVEKLADRWGVARNHLTRVWFEIDHGGSRPAV
jgi:anti-sigma regulatory factor (Ser/Thr protein kinase)